MYLWDIKHIYNSNKQENTSENRLFRMHNTCLLQNALNVFEHYCQLWKLEVNIEKT